MQHLKLSKCNTKRDREYLWSLTTLCFLLGRQFNYSLDSFHTHTVDKRQKRDKTSISTAEYSTVQYGYLHKHLVKQSKLCTLHGQRQHLQWSALSISVHPGESTLHILRCRRSVRTLTSSDVMDHGIYGKSARTDDEKEKER